MLVEDGEAVRLRLSSSDMSIFTAETRRSRILLMRRLAMSQLVKYPGHLKGSPNSMLARLVCPCTQAAALIASDPADILVLLPSLDWPG